MFSGLSAIHYEGQKQTVTPVIKATLRENFKGITLPFIRSDINSSRAQGIYFNNHYIIFHLDNLTSVKALTTFDRTSSGFTQIAQTLLSVPAGAQDCEGGKFIECGSTLIFYTFGNSVNVLFPHNISRVISGDGVNWGASNFVFYGTSAIADITPISENKLYYMEDADIVAGTYTRKYVLRKLEFDGVSWGASTVSAGIHYNPRIDGVSYAGVDVLCVNSAGSSRAVITAGSLVRKEVSVITTQDGDVFSEDNILSSENVLVRQRNLSIGASYYYLNLDTRVISYKLAGGVTTMYTDGGGQYVLRSVDPRSWSIPVFHGITAYPLVTGGNTLPTYSLFGASVMMDINLGATSIDISDNIINYQNQNNERISLTLGNYK